LHLDLKPENILVFADGRAAIADFGTSRLVRRATRTSFEAGTIGYMAPEQAYGRAQQASDVFALGLIAYELLTGQLPAWPFSWPPKQYARFVERVPAPLRPVLRRAAAFDPRQRFSDGIELHSALEAAFQRSEQPERRNGSRRRRKEAPSLLALAATTFRRRHGAALDLRHACRHCHGPLAEPMMHCPWCGRDAPSFRDRTRYPLVCPECERGVQPEWTACPWCYAGRLEGNGHAPPADPQATRRCSRRKCSGSLRPFMRYCPVCKTKTRRPWSHPALPHRCSRCRGPVSHEYWRHCPWCGRRDREAGAVVRRAAYDSRPGLPPDERRRSASSQAAMRRS
jgi:hypothetical protein